MPPSVTPKASQKAGIDFRQRALLDLEHGGLETARSSREVLGRVLVGKAQVEFALLAGRRAAHARFEVGQQAAGAEDDHEVLALAAVERFAVDAALEIDRDAVAVRQRARPRSRRAAAGAGSRSSCRRRHPTTAAVGRVSWMPPTFFNSICG